MSWSVSNRQGSRDVVLPGNDEAASTSGNGSGARVSSGSGMNPGKFLRKMFATPAPSRSSGQRVDMPMGLDARQQQQVTPLTALPVRPHTTRIMYSIGPVPQYSAPVLPVRLRQRSPPLIGALACTLLLHPIPFDTGFNGTMFHRLMFQFCDWPLTVSRKRVRTIAHAGVHTTRAATRERR